MCQSYRIIIPLKPHRTSFKLGIYLTSYNDIYSRKLEDILSIGYTPHMLYSIDIKSLRKNGYNLIDNEDNPLKFPLIASNLTRIWPAFGQVGGASEVIATWDSKDLDLTSEDENDFTNTFSSPSNNCIEFKLERTMINAPRYQIFTADTVSPTSLYDLNRMYNFLKNIYSENQDGGFLGDISAKGSIAKITDAGVIIKPHLKEIYITLSAGLGRCKIFVIVT